MAPGRMACAGAGGSWTARVLGLVCLEMLGYKPQWPRGCSPRNFALVLHQAGD